MGRRLRFYVQSTCYLRAILDDCEEEEGEGKDLEVEEEVVYIDDDEDDDYDHHHHYGMTMVDTMRMVLMPTHSQSAFRIAYLLKQCCMFYSDRLRHKTYTHKQKRLQ